MKNIHILAILQLVFFPSFSQSYTVQFIPTNATEIIDSVKVLNLSTNIISTIPAETGMHLVGSNTAVADIYASKSKLKISPNLQNLLLNLLLLNNNVVFLKQNFPLFCTY